MNMFITISLPGLVLTAIFFATGFYAIGRAMGIGRERKSWSSLTQDLHARNFELSEKNQELERKVSEEGCTNWKSGWAICRVCSWRWIAVRRSCVDPMECPACHEMAGEEADPEEV
jgi:hypothetical protein